MSYNLHINDGALVITDSTGSEFEKAYPKRSMWVDFRRLSEKSVLTIYGTDSVNQNSSSVWSKPLAECQIEGVAATEQNIKTFTFLNLGKINGTGGSGFDNSTNEARLNELEATKDFELQIVTRAYGVGETFQHTDGKNYRTNIAAAIGETPTTDPLKFMLISGGIPQFEQHNNTSRDAILNPAVGLTITNTENGNNEFFDGVKWVVKSSGSVKIASNVDLSEPEFLAINNASGMRRIMYTNPLLDASVFYPDSSPSKDVNSIYNIANGIFLENPVLGQPQYFRISLSYSGKNANNTGNINISLINPISGFDRVVGYSLPSGKLAEDFITLDFCTYADINSLLPPLGIGLGGYQLWIENTDNTVMDIVIKDIARLTDNFK